jgi:hypothetical protein
VVYGASSQLCDAHGWRGGATTCACIIEEEEGGDDTDEILNTSHKK